MKNFLLTIFQKILTLFF